MQRVLDLGCGNGDSWRSLGSDVDNWQLIGLDPQAGCVCSANRKYGKRRWRYMCARGEAIPLADGSVEGVICRSALPYMLIPQVLAEVRRVLVPGGWLWMTMHHPAFTWREIRRSFPNPKPTLGRSFVLLNGVYFHLTGKLISLGNKTESCQTEAGMRIALRRLGFRNANFWHEGEVFLVKAQREGGEVALGLCA